MFFIRTVVIPFLIIGIVACSRESKHDWLKKGDALYSKGKYQEAAVAYRKSLQKDARFGEAYYGYALAEIARNQPSKAVGSLRRAIVLMPAHEASRVKLADLYLAGWLNDPRRPKQTHDEIDSLINQILALNPNSFDGLRLKGQLAKESGDAKAALESFEKAEQAKPGDPATILALTELLFVSEPKRAEQLGKALLQSHKIYAPMYDLLYLEYMQNGRTGDAEALLQSKRQALPRDVVTMMQIASHYSRMNRTAEMRRILDELVSDGANYPNRYIVAGDFYFARREFAEALKFYRAGLQGQAGNAKEYHTRITSALLAESKTEEAAQELENFLRQSPNDPDARAGRASLWLQTGRPEAVDRSLSEFAAVVKEHPENAAFHYSFARAYLAKGDRKSAEAELREATRRDTNLTPARILLADLHLENRRPREALKEIVEALEVDSDNPGAHVLLARALQLTGRVAEARKELAGVLKAFPRFRDAELQMAYVELDEKNFKEAEGSFTRLFRPGHDDVEPMRGLVEVYRLQNQPGRALNIVKTEIDKNPRSPKMRYLLATLASQSGNDALALEQYRALMEAGLHSEPIYRLTAEIYYKRGQIDKAVESLRQAHALAPNDPDVAVLLGSIIERTGRKSDARALYRRALAIDSKHAVAMNNLAFSLAETGENLDEALMLATNASRAAGADLNFTDTLGWVYFKRNMHDSALQTFTNIVSKQPDNPTFRLHLGMALLAKGDKMGAKRELDAALKNKPSREQEASIRSLLSQVGS